jgi:putative FmdB family regulatory protein
MPLYEFDCLTCGQSFEKLVRSAAAVTEVVCPTCGKPHVQKKMSVFASTNKGDHSFSALSSSAAACAPGGT